MIKQTNLGLVILSIAFLSCSTHAQTTKPTAEPSYTIEQLCDGAQRLYLNTNKASNAGAKVNVEDIPAEFWTDEIRSLKPVRIYLHHWNIVVVQHEEFGVETGKYFTSPISSWSGPIDGRFLEGFAFIRISPPTDRSAAPQSTAFSYMKQVEPPGATASRTSPRTGGRR